MPECEDCGEEQRRRVRCFHCGLLICSWCWNHVHCCEPGHTRDKCSSWYLYKKYGLEFLKEMRRQVLRARKAGYLNWHKPKGGEIRNGNKRA